ncbi:MAG: hypothetical protein ACXVDT_11840, partial [Bacteroidia bacterium]
PTVNSIYCVSKMLDSLKKLCSLKEGFLGWHNTSAFLNDTIYETENDGRLFAINARNGNYYWQYSLSGHPDVLSPIVFGDNIIFGENDYNLKTGIVYSYNITSGQIASLKLPHYFSSPIVSLNGMLFTLMEDGYACQINLN